jgi:hypothetical protein
VIELDSDAMETMPMGTPEKISRFIVGDRIWEAMEKKAQELGSWMAEQGNVPLLIRYEGRRSTTMGVMRQVTNGGEEVMWVPRRETRRDQEEDGNQRKEENQEAGYPRRRHRVRLDGDQRMRLGTRAMERMRTIFKRGCQCSGIGWANQGQIPYEWRSCM